jgi:hypothetical protein
MPAHSQVANIVEEENTGRAAGICRFREKRSHQNIGSAGLIHHHRPEVIVFVCKPPETFGQGGFSEVGTSFDHHTCRFAGGVGVKDSNGRH